MTTVQHYHNHLPAKILFLTNNENTSSLIYWLRETAHEEVVIEGNKLTAAQVRRVKPDFVISYNYQHIISETILKLLPNKFINLHIAYLPWNRGADPNPWSFLENTPKGVTIHVIDKGIDTGKVLAQRKIFIDIKTHTLTSSYLLLQDEMQKLFKENWSAIKSEKIQPRPQKRGGSIHYLSQHAKIVSLLQNNSWNIQIEEFIRQYQKQSVS